GHRLDGFHLIWSAGLVIAFLFLVVSVVTVARRELNAAVGDPKPPLFATFLSGAILTSAVPIALLLKGQYWAAGKGLAVISPFVFVLMMLPLLSPKRSPSAAGLAWIVVAGQLMFGI